MQPQYYPPQPQGQAIPPQWGMVGPVNPGIPTGGGMVQMPMQSSAFATSLDAFAPTAAPTGQPKYASTNRWHFQEGTYQIRFVGHPVLLPNGFRIYTRHFIPQDGVDEYGRENRLYFLCTESYDPKEPCYMCSLLRDLDEYSKSQGVQGIFQPQILGRQVWDVLYNNSTAQARQIFFPALVRARAGTVPGKKGSSKDEWPALFPDSTQLTTITLKLWPNKRNDYGNLTGDGTLCQRIQHLVLNDQQVQERYQQLMMASPTDAAKFAAELGGMQRNPMLFDPQFGSWLQYTKARNSQTLTILPNGTGPLGDREREFLSEDIYPNILEWGRGSEHRDSEELPWPVVSAAFRSSVVGQVLEQRFEWNCDLDYNEFRANVGGYRA